MQWRCNWKFFFLFCRVNSDKGRKTKSGNATHLDGVLIVFLTLCLAATSQLGSLYAHGHGDHIIIGHSYKDETDPCHRLIYHNDSESGCDHDVHLTASDKCCLCDFAVHSDTSFVTTFHLNLKFDQNFVDVYKTNLDSYSAVLSSSRAPPSIT